VVDFTKSAATAKRLIDANGRTVTVAKRGNNPQDSDKPWRGQADYDIATVSGKAVFVNSSDLGYSVLDEDNVKRSVKVALFAASNDGGEELETFDEIRDGNVKWQITKAELLAPADTRVLYAFEVER
jgi:hypothetical protein